MPKIRGVKPDYWTDEDIVELSVPARLLFIGMWNYACDNGHLQDKPKQIKMRVLPGDDVNCAELLRELATKHRIIRVDGWIIVPNFTKHQKPDKRYFQTCDKVGCERPPADSQPGTRGGHDESTTSPPRAHGVGSMGPHVDGDGDGDGELKVMVTSALPDKSGKKPSAKRATQRPADFRPSQAHIDLASERSIDLRHEWAKFCDWSDANGKAYKDWNAALRNWIRNARPTSGGAQSRADGFLTAAQQLHDQQPTIGELT